MGAIKTAANSAYRDYNTDGIPASGPYWPPKSAIRGLFATVEDPLPSIQPGTVSDVSMRVAGVVHAEENVTFTGSGVYPLSAVSSNPIVVGHAGITVGSSTVGQTFILRFQWGANDISIGYTAIAGDTTSTIATKLAALVQANTTIHGLADGLPIFAQAFGNVINVQYSHVLSASGATPLTLTKPGTGTMNIPAPVDILDYPVSQFGRSVSGRVSQPGDSVYAFDHTGMSSAGFDTHYAIMGVSAQAVASGAQQGRWTLSVANNGSLAKGALFVERGMVFYNSLGSPATGLDKGFGTINLPAGGACWFDGVSGLTRNAGSGQLILQTTTTDNLVLSSSGSGGVGVNLTPTGLTFSSALGMFVSGVQTPTTGSGISLAGGATPVLAARNYATSTALPLAFSGTVFSPATDDGAALGTTALKWSDLFLASGAVINWNNGDVLATHSANLLAFTGASSGYTFDAPLTASVHKSASGAAQFTAASAVGVNVAASGNIGINTASPQTQFHAHIGTDQNTFWVDGTTAGNLASLGVGIWSLKDDVATWTPLSFKASQHNFLQGGVSVGDNSDAGANNVNAVGVFKVAGTQVVGARSTGWSAMTGTTNKATVYDTATVTLAQLAGRVMALQAALTTHGMLGA